MPLLRYRVLLHVPLLPPTLIWMMTGQVAFIAALGRWLGFESAIPLTLASAVEGARPCHSLVSAKAVLGRSSAS
jgi:Flp pilus assembly protein protease CpaA